MSQSPKNRRRPDRAVLAAALIAAAWSTLAVPAAAAAETAREKGLRIAREADRRDLGWGDSVSRARMILRNKHGQSSQRWMRFSSLEGRADGDKSIIVFDRPFDIAGTALLTFTHKKGDDDQWLYLPALKRVKRISSSNKSGSFVGSEFAYEDLSSQEVEKYTYKYLRDETVGGLDAFVNERRPVDPRSGYTRQVTWIDKAEYRVLKIEFYDRKNSHLKTLLFKDYRKYLGRFWRPHRLEMVNHQTGKSTHLLWSGYRFKTGLSEGDFNRNALKRAR